MITVEMTDDIRKFQNKVAGPFTMRQVVCVIAGVIVAVPVFLLWKADDITDKVFPALIAMLPIASLGWITMDGCPAEMILLRILYKSLAAPKRKAMIESTMHKDFEKLKKKRLQKKNGGKNTKETIKYSQNKKYKIYC